MTTSLPLLCWYYDGIAYSYHGSRAKLKNVTHLQENRQIHYIPSNNVKEHSFCKFQLYDRWNWLSGMIERKK